jgi:hypothetical protein
MKHSPEKWTEFDWETIFKKEVFYAKKYIQLFSKYAGIPGEDEIIMAQVNQEEADYLEFCPAALEDFCEENELPWKNNEDKIFNKIAKLAKNWLLIQVCLSADQKSDRKTLKSVVTLGLILRRMITAVHAADELPAMSLAQFKRIKKDVDGLAETLNRIRLSQSKQANAVILKYISDIGEISELISEEIMKIRKNF